MANISEINQLSSYQGQAEAGGHLGIGITISDTPIDRFATFKFYSDQAKWQEKQTQDAQAAKQIAALSAFDTSSPLKGYTNDLTLQLESIHDELKKDPTVLTYDPKNPQKFIDFQKKIGDFENKRQFATTNDVLYNAQKNKVDLMPNGPEKDLEQSKLTAKVNKLFDGGVDTAYNKQIEITSPPKPENSLIPDADASKSIREGFVKLPNDNVHTKITFTDPSDLRARSTMEYAQSQKTDDIKNQPWFKKLNPDEQAIELAQGGLSAEKRQALDDTSNTINSLFTEWQKAHPDVDIDTVDVNTLPNDSFGNNIRFARQKNNEIEELNSYINKGALTDKDGNVIVKPFDKINLKDGIDAPELIFMQSLQKSKKPLLESATQTAVHTGDATKLQLERENRASAEKIAAGRNYVDLFNGREGRKMQEKIANLKLDAKDGKTTAITDVAQYMLDHIKTSSDFFKNNKSVDFTVPAAAADPVIKQALHIGPAADGSVSTSTAVAYKQFKDGKISVLNEKGEVVEKLDLNVLKLRISQVLHGSKTGDIDAKTQEDIDKSFSGTGNLNNVLNQELSAKPAADNTKTVIKDSYQLNGKTFTLDKIKKAASQSDPPLSVEEYLKQGNFQ